MLSSLYHPQPISTATLSAYWALVNDSTLEAAYCAQESAAFCEGICTNTDIAGVGVRLAFYLQSVFTVLLVVFSPDESPSAAWSSVLFTSALIIAAIAQKVQGQLTLFHATLVLNFATLSTLASLAIAPRCTVWRLGEAQLNPTRKEVRGRVMLSVAMLVQLVLQWAWIVYMFVAPDYAQAYCNAQTVVVFFGVPFQGQDIDPQLRTNYTTDAGDGDAPSYFFVWPLWLLTCFGVTLLYAVVLAATSSSSAHPSPSPSASPTPPESSPASPHPDQLQALYRAQPHPPAPQQRSPTWLILNNTFALLLFAFFVGTCEAQHAQSINELLLPGEDVFIGGFGQVTAFLVAFAPLWTVCGRVVNWVWPDVDESKLSPSEASDDDRGADEDASIINIGPGSYASSTNPSAPSPLTILTTAGTSSLSSPIDSPISYTSAIRHRPSPQRGRRARPGVGPVRRRSTSADVYEAGSEELSSVERGRIHTMDEFSIPLSSVGEVGESIPMGVMRPMHRF